MHNLKSLKSEWTNKCCGSTCKVCQRTHINSSIHFHCELTLFFLYFFPHRVASAFGSWHI